MKLLDEEYKNVEIKNVVIVELIIHTNISKNKGGK